MKTNLDLVGKLLLDLVNLVEILVVCVVVQTRGGIWRGISL